MSIIVPFLEIHNVTTVFYRCVAFLQNIHFKGKIPDRGRREELQEEGEEEETEKKRDLPAADSFPRWLCLDQVGLRSGAPNFHQISDWVRWTNTGYFFPNLPRHIPRSGLTHRDANTADGGFFHKPQRWPVGGLSFQLLLSRNMHLNTSVNSVWLVFHLTV